MKTYTVKGEYTDRKWYVIDAKGKTLGRLASRIATILRGKHKAIYSPYLDLGDHVVVVNADKVHVTGKKRLQKTYGRYSGYPGGLKITTFDKLMQSKPTRTIELAVKGMLPHNALGRQMYRKLKVYSGASHPHAAQQPESLQI